MSATKYKVRVWRIQRKTMGIWVWVERGPNDVLQYPSAELAEAIRIMIHDVLPGQDTRVVEHVLNDSPGQSNLDLLKGPILQMAEQDGYRAKCLNEALFRVWSQHQIDMIRESFPGLGREEVEQALYRGWTRV